MSGGDEAVPHPPSVGPARSCLVNAYLGCSLEDWWRKAAERSSGEPPPTRAARREWRSRGMPPRRPFDVPRTSGVGGQPAAHHRRRALLDYRLPLVGHDPPRGAFLCGGARGVRCGSARGFRRGATHDGGQTLARVGELAPATKRLNGRTRLDGQHLHGRRPAFAAPPDLRAAGDGRGQPRRQDTRGASASVPSRVVLPPTGQPPMAMAKMCIAVILEPTAPAIRGSVTVETVLPASSGTAV